MKVVNKPGDHGVRPRLVGPSSADHDLLVICWEMIVNYSHAHIHTHTVTRGLAKEGQSVGFSSICPTVPLIPHHLTPPLSPLLFLLLQPTHTPCQVFIQDVVSKNTARHDWWEKWRTAAGLPGLQHRQEVLRQIQVPPPSTVRFTNLAFQDKRFKWSNICITVHLPKLGVIIWREVFL